MKKSNNIALKRIQECLQEQATTLDLSDLGLKELPSEISRLKHLNTLDCSENEITDLSPLKGLGSLNELDCSENEIRDVSPLGGLGSLNTLNCSDNQIRDLSPLTGLSSLNRLDCSDNQIRDLSSLAGLDSLNELFCPSNQITDLSPLAGLDSLNELFCFGNQIKDLSPLAGLGSLNTLHCSNNQITDLSPLRGLSFLNRLHCWSNPITTPPMEVVNQGLEAIREYLRAVEKHGTVEFREVKVMLVGSPGGGKTTLRRRILGEDIPAEEFGTPGVDMAVWRFRDQGKEYRANIWDFAGQEINYSLHELFYSRRSIFVLLLDGRTEDRPEKWLERIKLLANQDARILLVRNKNDDTGYKTLSNFDVNELTEKYPALREGLFEMSARKGTGCDEFLRTLRQTVTDHPQSREKYPKNYLNIKKTVEERTQKGQNHITHETYSEICNENELPGKQAQKHLLQVLSDLGTVTFFNDPELANIRILNPEWLSLAAYKLLHAAENREAGGFIDKKDFPQYLQAAPGREHEAKLKLQEHEYPWIENMMVKHLQMLPIDGERFLIPRGLRSDIQLPKRSEDCLRFRLKYKSLPEGFFPKLIVKTYRYRKESFQGREKLLLERTSENKSNRAFVLLGEKDIRIWIDGDKAQRHAFLTLLREEFTFLHADYPGIEPKEFVPLDDFDGEELLLKAICRELERGEQKHFNMNLDQEFDLAELIALPASDGSKTTIVKNKIVNHGGNVYVTESGDIRHEEKTIHFSIGQIEDTKTAGLFLNEFLALLDNPNTPEREALQKLAETLTSLSNRGRLPGSEKEPTRSIFQKGQDTIKAMLKTADTAIKAGEKLGKVVEVGGKCLPYIEQFIELFQ
ncbi:COR domain-containing protein [Candidatus Haliotispira prima]|uniref:COR domain-containing protein n=1 Tax=Candidatus Haliotispira prima TaxID=3034016 RepID=A0ABY8MJC2_9SPIO|nr:COR domain-containing protein [Candidatus Haliotispira prima]